MYVGLFLRVCVRFVGSDSIHKGEMIMASVLRAMRRWMGVVQRARAPKVRHPAKNGVKQARRKIRGKGVMLGSASYRG